MGAFRSGALVEGAQPLGQRARWCLGGSHLRRGMVIRGAYATACVDAIFKCLDGERIHLTKLDLLQNDLRLVDLEKIANALQDNGCKPSLRGAPDALEAAEDHAPDRQRRHSIAGMAPEAATPSPEAKGVRGRRMSMPNISTPGGGTSGGEAAEDLQGIDHEEDLEDIDGDADDDAAPEEAAPAPESPPTPRTKAKLQKAPSLKLGQSRPPLQQRPTRSSKAALARQRVWR